MLAFSERYEYLRDYLDATFDERNSHFLLGIIVFIGFPTLSILQNFIISLVVNFPKNNEEFAKSCRKLWEISKTDVTSFSSVFVFSASRKSLSVFLIIISYFTYICVPLLFITILLESNLKVVICYGMKGMYEATEKSVITSTTSMDHKFKF